jgi:hypothetical protein
MAGQPQQSAFARALRERVMVTNVRREVNNMVEMCNEDDGLRVMGA